MFMLAGAIILAVIGLCALPFVLALAWAVAPFVIAFTGFAVFLVSLNSYDFGGMILGAVIGLAGGAWVHIRNPEETAR